MMMRKSANMMLLLICFMALLFDTVFAYKITKLGENSANINFTVDKESTILLRYGNDINHLNELYSGINMGKKHRAMLSSLKKGKLYYFIAEFFDGRNKVSAEKGYFVTKGRPDPDIETVKVKNLNWKSSMLEIISSVKMDLNVECFRPKQAGKKIDLKKAPSVRPVRVNKEVKIKKNWGAKVQRYESKYMLEKLQPLKEYIVNISGKGNISDSTQTVFDSGEHNIAMGKKVYGTFDSRYIADRFELKGDVLKRVTDGSFNYVNGMAVSHQIEKGDQWVVIDLNKNQSISKIITYWRAMCYPEYYKLEYITEKKGDKPLVSKKSPTQVALRSLLNAKWKVIKKKVDVKNSPKIGINGMPVKKAETDCNNINARYIRLFIKKGSEYTKKRDFYNFVQLLEMKVYPKEK